MSKRRPESTRRGGGVGEIYPKHNGKEIYNLKPIEIQAWSDICEMLNKLVEQEARSDRQLLELQKIQDGVNSKAKIAKLCAALKEGGSEELR
jgi:hypothetical protein